MSSSLSNIAGGVLFFAIGFGCLFAIYSIGCGLTIASSWLICRGRELQRTDWLFGFLSFIILPISWLFWWIVADRGVYGWLNMMHESFWAGFIGGLFAFLRVWFSGRVKSPKLVSISVVTVGIFMSSFFLWHIFDL